MKLTKTHKVRAISDVSPREREESVTPFNLDTTLTSTTFNERTQLREIDSILLIMDSLSDTALTIKQMFFDLKMRNESEKVECMRKVTLFRDKLKQLADDFEHHIFEELDYHQDAENIHIQSKIEECESLFNTIEISKDMTQCLKTEVITPQTLRKVNAARQRCNEYKFALQRIHSGIKTVQYNLAIDRNISDAINSSPSIIGKVEVSHENDDFFEQTVSYSERSTNVSSNSLSLGRGQMRVNSAQNQKLQDIFPHRSDDISEPMIVSICTLNNNHFITLDRSNNKILLIHKDGTIVTQYVFTSPVWGMTLVDSITAAVTLPDSDKIVLVKVRNNNLCAEKLIKTSNICFGICSIESFIVVTTKGGHIKILSKAGEEVASIRHNSRGEVLFSDPQHISTNREQNELYVTDNTLHTVTGLYLTGVKIDPHPKFVFRNNELRNPTGLCLDVTGNVYVCGLATHNVLKLSQEGQLLMVVLTGVISPQAVALSITEDRLYLSMLGTHKRNVIAQFKI